MKLGSARLRIPASVEFLARCAVAIRRRFGTGPRGGANENRPAPAGDPLEPAALAEALRDLGIHRGDLLMVHSSGAAVEQWGWELSALIDFLLDYLGPTGTLAMPTHPKLLRRNDRWVYDLRRSSSTVGLLTELFRRRKDATRSRFPLSAAAAMGARAEELVGDHHRSYAPHDEHSPYAKLAELDGKSLCVGCSLDRMTVLHVAEDVLRDELPVDGFHESREVSIRDGEQEQSITVHQRAEWLWWYLSLGRWTHEMYRRSLARDRLLVGIPLRAANARDTVEWMKDEVRAGRWIYPLARANRWLRLGAPPRIQAG